METKGKERESKNGVPLIRRTEAVAAVLKSKDMNEAVEQIRAIKPVEYIKERDMRKRR